MTCPSPVMMPSISNPVRVLDPATGHVISPIVAAALCIKPRGMLTPNQSRKVDALKQASPDFAAMRSLAMRFRGVFRGRKVSRLDDWLADARGSDIEAMRRFARAIERDVDAVRNAVELPGATGKLKGRSTASRPSNVPCTAEPAQSYCGQGCCQTLASISTQIEEDPNGVTVSCAPICSKRQRSCCTDGSGGHPSKPGHAAA